MSPAIRFLPVLCMVFVVWYSNASNNTMISLRSSGVPKISIRGFCQMHSEQILLEKWTVLMTNLDRSWAVHILANCLDLLDVAVSKLPRLTLL
jgi:hypothetical protein